MSTSDHHCIDIHSHVGALCIDEAQNGALLGTMAEGGLSAIVLSVITDNVITRWGTDAKPGLPGAMLYKYREPEPGECYRDVHAQFDQIDDWLSRLGVPKILSPDDIGATPGMILAAEGGCHLEGKPERLQEFYERGMRSMQLVHYRINELADIQTSPPEHGGLTDAGRAVVREMNRLGIIVDVTHATFEVVRDMAEVSSKPIVLSHAVLQEDPPHPRFVAPDYARVVAQTGGVVGVQAAAFQGRGLPGHIEKIKRMVDAIGIEHVGIGTDMGTAAWPPAAWSVFPDLKPFAKLPGLLVNAGFDDDEVAKITSGNFLRVFTEVAPGRA
jgi:membrane dipeptidase